MHRFVRRGGAVVVVLAVTLGLGGCTASGPMGLRRDGDRLVVVLGRQCVPASYLTEIELSGIDESRHEAVDPPVWKIKAVQPRAVPEVVVGTVPDGYVEVVNNVATEGLTGRASLQATFGDYTYAVTLDIRKIHGGKVLTADDKLMTVTQFRTRNGCS
jgi:hypothetical protein